jgi:NADH-quinone oxidoreductase subunit C
MDTSGLQPAIRVERADYAATCGRLAAAGWELEDLTALDREAGLEVVVWFVSYPADVVSVRVPCPDPDPHVESLVAIFPSAEWPEREVFDMFGVVFGGHPDMTRLLLPDSYVGHPLRKSFELVEQTW